MKKKIAKCISILGTGSDVGKSIVVAALCRIFNDAGISTAPFKAQNMSNNSSVTEAGGEMGRAQVVQAQAARIEPHTDMNPVLLKPGSDIGSQVIVHGKPLFHVEAGEYFRDTDFLFEKSKESLERLQSQYELIIMEGAGSCGEVNLRQRDFVNFKIADVADAPVILVADIDRGGVFAQIIGTLTVISEEDRKKIKGIIINRFRGDASLFDEGITYIEAQTGLPVLGLIPYFADIKIDSEDGVPLEILLDPDSKPQPWKINIAVIRLPHISNFTDFSPFENNPGINLHYLSNTRSLDGYDVVFLPGTKNVRGDLKWLKQAGWASKLINYAKNGGELGGICGGYQMLGTAIQDPEGIEGPPGEDKGLGLLKLVTVMKLEKILSQSVGTWISTDEQVEGYEIHMGHTETLEKLTPLIKLTSRNSLPARDYDGVSSPDGKIWGTYFHSLFDNEGLRKHFLHRWKPDYCITFDETSGDIQQFRDKQYNLLADFFRHHLEISKLREIIGI